MYWQNSDYTKIPEERKGSMDQTYFTVNGQPAWYTTDGEWFYSHHNHKPVAYLADDRKSLFSPSPSRYIGWLQSDWIYTTEGKPWMFGENA